MAKTKVVAKIGWVKEKANYTYYFSEKLQERYRCKAIVFHGYKQVPTGFQLLKTGNGFNLKQVNKFSGNIFLQALFQKTKKTIALHIYNNDKYKASLVNDKRTYTVSLSAKQFLFIVRDLGTQANDYKQDILEQRMSSVFKYKYTPKNEKLLPRNSLNNINIDNLSELDHKALIKVFQEYHKLYKASREIEDLTKSFIIQGNKDKLSKIVTEFESALKDASFSEKKWQEFLHNKVFKFMTNYVESFRETDVNTGSLTEGEKKPDFVWIDIYGFLDVFEIKTPFTDILAKRIDASHKNYYFSSDVTKAICQVEKYLLFLERNVERYKTYLQKQTSLPFSVIRPKAFLIIGNSKDINSNPQKSEDFRVLRRSLKNVEIITFNELLDNLKNILVKIDKK